MLIAPAEGWHEQDVQHLLKYPFLCKIEAKNAAVPQPDLPCSPSTMLGYHGEPNWDQPFCWVPGGSSCDPSRVNLNESLQKPRNQGPVDSSIKNPSRFLWLCRSWVRFVTGISTEGGGCACADTEKRTWEGTIRSTELRADPFSLEVCLACWRGLV